MNPEIARVRMTPKDFFLHLGITAALYVTVVSLLALIFQVVDFSFPDPLAYYRDPYSSGIRSAIASLIVFFPTYLILGWMYRKDTIAHPEKKDLGFRKWAVYLTLFLAGLAIVIDLVVLLNNFLGGEISSRFVLKIAAVLLVAGFVFVYYLMSLKGKTDSPAVFKGFSISSIVIVIATLAVGFSVLGSPMTQRNIRFDEDRVNDLQTIQWQVVSFWQQKEKLPVNLDELYDPLSGARIPIDPQTGANYEYRTVTATSTTHHAFELCATFAYPRVTRYPYENRMAYPMYDTSMPSYPYPVEGDSWEHEGGRVCFTRTIDPERYPPFEKPMVR